ncbi:MAG: hypothetical protein AB1847_15415 [bacterium]
MSIVSMYDFLDDVNPDYAFTLSVDPQEVMVISGEKEVEIHRGRGRSEERVILSDQSRFWAKLQWRVMNEADHSTLFDFYHDPNKGCGTARTFFWAPPPQYDSHIYVVRFDCRWESFMQNYKNYGVANLLFSVAGRKLEL